MYTGLIDTINSILQSIMFVISANYCVNKNYKKSKKQIILLSIILWLLITIVTKALGNSSLSIIIIHIAELVFLVGFAYKNDKLGATIGFTIVYLLIGLTVILTFSSFMFVINNTNVDVTYANILIMYLPQFFISYLVLKNMKFLFKIGLIIRSRISSIFTLIITTLVLDFTISFLFISNDKDNPIFKEIIFVFLAAFIIFITIYFASIDKKAKEINRLNRELAKKINELKKIKHDYGSQISYLYGAYLMGNYEKLGELLKGIIEGHDISSKVKVISSDLSLISQVVNSTDLKDVDVLIDENAELKHANISELDLQRIISNIIRNSVEALDGKGLLIIKSYYNYNHIIIHIQNNGPEISKDIIEKIFEEGFSTKENKNGDNGFGLYITKEIIDNCNGSISVSSNKDLTTFTIKLPFILNN
ncbi:ATP-binding protein [Clostridium sp. AL.422]|uniref:sensor histidine kinase n=1 Tax=Clostridium TaxID=1485 RepID=UPI00293DD2A1|nr:MULTISPECIES: ATP-binding protein [unclassified Clostridium]MDV4150144.1 ATP-binding protein [Clostridium sp. AL.422]